MDLEPDSYYLSWGGFQRNIKSSFADLVAEKCFVDVTLACEGEKQVSAHKVVLSACSPFFKQILVKNPHQHPLIYLKGVQYNDLVSLMTFVYLGEVKMKESEVQQFLKLSEELEVKGLSGLFIQPEIPKYATEDDILEIQSLSQECESDLDKAVFINDKDDLSEMAFKSDLDNKIKSSKSEILYHKPSVSSGLEDDDNLLTETPNKTENNTYESVLSDKDRPKETRFSVSSSVNSDLDTLNSDNSPHHLYSKSLRRRSMTVKIFGRSKSKERKAKREKSTSRLSVMDHLMKSSSSTNDIVTTAKTSKTGNKAYECHECGQLFRLEGSLSEHRETVHDQTTFKCVNCDLECQTKENLHRHKELKDHY